MTRCRQTWGARSRFQQRWTPNQCPSLRIWGRGGRSQQILEDSGDSELIKARNMNWPSLTCANPVDGAALRGFRFPASRKWLWDRTVQGPCLEVSLEVTAQSAMLVYAVEAHYPRDLSFRQLSVVRAVRKTNAFPVMRNPLKEAFWTETFMCFNAR